MTHIDLIPPELVEKHKSRKVIGLMIIGGLVVVFILLIVYLITMGQAIVATNRVDTIKKENTKVQAYIEKLKPYDDRKKVLDERQQIVTTFTADQVAWSGVLNDISMVIPGGIWLKSIKVDIDPILAAKETPSAGAKQELPPPITIVGYARNHADVARWLVHLGEINQFRSVWLDYATEQTVAASTAGSPGSATAAPQKLIEFQTTVRLTKFSEDTTGKK